MSILARTSYQVVCDCCGIRSPAMTIEASARAHTRTHNWDYANIDGRLADVCPRCATPGHDRAGCRL